MKNPSQPSTLVRSYLSDIGRIPLLTHEQEITLGKQVQQYMELKAVAAELAGLEGDDPDLEPDIEPDIGPDIGQWADAAGLSPAVLKENIAKGRRARKKMVKANLRLVVSIAKKYTGHSLDMMDLIQEGTIGLHRGVEKFDPTKGYRFSTYAYWWIRQAITRSLSNNSRVIRLPIHIGDQIRKMKKTQRKLSLSLGRTPKAPEVAEALSISVEKLRDLQTQARKPLSLDMRIGSEQNTALGELLEDEGLLPEEYATRRLLKFDLKQLLQTLNDQQQEVIRRRFGLDADSKMTLRQVGECMSLSPERVRQVERAALRRLRQRGRGLREYIVAS